MTDKSHTSGHAAINASVIALVAFLAGVLYFFGAAISGDNSQLTSSVAGAPIIDTRDVPN